MISPLNFKTCHTCGWIAIFLLLLSSTIAQIPTNNIGYNPHRFSWRQINTDRVQVVFPEGQEADARRVADIVSYLWDHEGQDIGQLRTKISIFLHGHRVSSNGLVTVGPFRSEFYQTPPQMGNSTRYLDLLTIHEYRHVQQFANATQGITKTIKSVLGSFAWGGMMATALPRWYFEGDAVIAETEHSASGRGRLPSFLMQYNALIEEGRHYSYEKAGARSYKDYVPDWYALGYHMLSYGRAQYGEDIWVNVAEDAVRYKGVFMPFSRNLKKRTGLTTTDLYNKTWESLSQSYHHKTLSAHSYDSVLGEEEGVINYSSPIYFGQSIITSQSAYNEVPAYYFIDASTGDKTKLVEHGRLSDNLEGTLSTDGRKIYWAELGYDVRWPNQQWSVLFSYDVATGTKEQLTKKSRLFAPDVSPSGDRIVAVHIDPNQMQHLVILDLDTQDAPYEIPHASEALITHPRWYDTEHILAVLSDMEESFLAKINIATGIVSPLTPPTVAQLSHPIKRGDYIYYASAYDDINNIYALNIRDSSIYQVTHSSIGAFHPYIDKSGTNMVFMEFTAAGYKLRSLEVDPSMFVRRDMMLGDGGKTHNHSDVHSILSNLPEGAYNIERYNKLTGLLNPHSLLTEIDDRSAELILRSDNKLSTMSIEGGLRYEFNEDRWGYRVGMNYAEFYPIIHAGVSRIYRSAELLNFASLTDTSLVFTDYIGEWAENSASIGVTIPFIFSRGNMNNSLRIRSDFIRTGVDISTNIETEGAFRDTLEGARSVSQFEDLIDAPLREGGFSTVDTRLSFQMIKSRALQHVAPRMGVSLFGRYRNNLSDAAFGGDTWSYGSNIWLPGLGKNHSLHVQTFFQHEDVLSPYRYGDAYAYPRGYNVSFRRDDFGKIGVNYAFPIAYPDIAIGGLAFVKRLKGRAFYDHGWMRFTSFPGASTTQLQRSLGFELGIDFRALRLVEVDLGIRYSYLLDGDLIRGRKHQIDFFVISIRE